MSKYFKLILQTSGHRKVMFMGGEFTGTYMYVKPQEKMSHDYLRGYGSVHDSKRLGARMEICENDAIMIIKLNVRRLDIRNIFFSFFPRACLPAENPMPDCVYTGQSPDVHGQQTVFILASLQICKLHLCTGVGGEKAGGGVAVGVLCEQVTQRWFRAVNVGGGGSGEMEETACERSHGCRRQVGRPPRNPSVAGSRTQEDGGGLSFVARQQSQQCCCFSAPPAP
jgi:hypothetical protein